MKMHATFGAKYYTGNALPSGDVCARCGRDEAGMLWLDCWVISATWGVPQKEAHAACSKGAVEYMFLCDSCEALLEEEGPF